MRRRTIAFLALAAFGLSGGAHGIGTDTRQIHTIYDIYLGGLWIAEMKVDADIGPEEYRAAAALQTKGLVEMVYKASFEAEAEGTVKSEGLATSLFVADSRSKKKNQYVEMRYRNGRPDNLRAVPEFDPKPWQIDPRQQTNTADPLSAAVGSLVLPPGAPLCNKRVDVFDGRKRYAVVMEEPEEVDGLVRCKAIYKRIGGYKPKHMAQPDYPLTLWFEPTEDGGFRIQKAVGRTPIGVAVIRQRKET
ncbi:MAG: DUF3108 domain-containing protein [Pseudomonadota bacterium]